MKNYYRKSIDTLFCRARAMLLLPVALYWVSIPLQGAVIYDLNSAVLDGGAGENTFFVSNGQGSPAGLAYEGGTPSLTWTEGTSGAYTYMVGYFNSTTLAKTGDSISLNFSITPSSTAAFSSADLSLRIGLFNSGGSKLTSNVGSSGSPTLSAYTGYMGAYRPNGTTSSSDTFYKRTTTNSVLMATGAYSPLPGSPTLVSPGTGSIAGTLSLTLVPTGLEISCVLDGGTVQSFIDTSGLVTTFDSFSFFATSGSVNPTLTFTNLSVTSVPEPSTFALLAGGIFCLAYLRHGRSKRH